MNGSRYAMKPRFKLSTPDSDSCSNADVGTLFHCSWDGPRIREVWKDVLDTLSQITTRISKTVILVEKPRKILSQRLKNLSVSCLGEMNLHDSYMFWKISRCVQVSMKDVSGYCKASFATHC